MISNPANKWDKGLQMACQGGHIEIAKIMISNDGNIETGLITACYSGNIETAKLMVAHGVDLRIGLIYACRMGNIDMVKMMISNITDDRSSISFCRGLYDACQSNCVDIVQLLIDNGVCYIDFYDSEHLTDIVWDYLIKRNVRTIYEFGRNERNDRIDNMKVEMTNISYILKDKLIPELGNIIMEY
jgi:ankyrin repeat protein